MRLTPRGVTSEPLSRRFPDVIGGTCEFCGTLDPNVQGQHQYQLCEHYKGMELKCVYCPPTKDQEDVVRSSTLHVAEHPFRPGELVVWCGSFECSKNHREAFGAPSA
jgi:hypothetical protein